MSNHDNTATQLLLSSSLISPKLSDFSLFCAFKILLFRLFFWKLLKRVVCFGLRIAGPAVGFTCRNDLWEIFEPIIILLSAEIGPKRRSLFRSERLILIFFLLIGKIILWHKISTNFSSIGNDH